MNDAEEVAYVRGSTAAWTQMLAMCLRNVGEPERTIASLQRERAEAVAMLRQVCETWGDNDWPDNRNLADVIEKHLWNALEANA